ncbi:MAG: hypothetical protein L0Z50_43045 [Verrucomicrobiales bacterium]|nr:hypothetical protein [Verrucomicrobiales bacterium]
MNPILQIVDDLGSHLALCQEICAHVERESHLLQNGDERSTFAAYQEKKGLLPQLEESLNRIREHRNTWRNLDPVERARYAKVQELVKANQDLIMKIIVLDRENEQALLRKGLGCQRPPLAASPPRPHYVAGLYHRNAQQA